MHTRFIRCLLLAVACSAASIAAASGYRPPDALSDGWSITDAGRAGWATERFDQLESRIADKTYKNITSVVIAQGGQLVYERYFEGGGRDTLNDMRSATKSITAFLAGAAIDRHLIADVKAKVYAFFPDRKIQHPDPRKDAFTLEDLLTMSSLWECDDENQFSSGNEERMYVSEDWLQFALDLPIKGFAPWMTKPADSPYGRAFAYCTAGAFVAGAIVERAAKQPLNTFAAAALERPLGITQSKWNLAPGGVIMGGGGTRYRSRDIAKIGQLVVDGGRWQGKQVLSPEWITAATTPHAKARDDAEYGYLLWRMHFPLRGRDTAVWAMSGNGGNYVFMLPEQKLVAVITSTAYNQRYAHPQSQEIFRDFILAALPASR